MVSSKIRLASVFVVTQHFPLVNGLCYEKTDSSFIQKCYKCIRKKKKFRLTRKEWALGIRYKNDKTETKSNWAN